MNALFLGGNSPRHNAWIHAMAEMLGQPFETVVVHEYKHWQTGAEWIALDDELVSVAAKMEDLEPYVVFAKSIGTVLALKGMATGALKPTSCLFLGLPLTVAADMDLPVKEWFEQATVPMYFIQNDHDPYASAEELKTFVAGSVSSGTIIILPGDSHDYNDDVVMRDVLKKCVA